jgi:hypothetical protein
MHTPIEIGRLPQEQVREFGRFCDGQVDLLYGEILPDGTRRIMCPPEQSHACSVLYARFTGQEPIPQPVYETQSPTGWGDRLAAALTSVGITKERYSQWLGKECNCTERQMKLNSIGQWVESWFGGKKSPPPIPPARTVVGCIHEGTVDAFREHVKNIPGVEFGHRPTESMHRRIIDTLGHATRLRDAVIAWNGGTDRPASDKPYVAGTWSYAVTAVPSRLDLLAKTIASLADGGFPDPIISVDGQINDPAYVSYPHIGTFKHWHRTLLDLYSRNPWSQYYAIFQDDMICVQNLRQYIELSQIPEKSYLNLFTFMENEGIVKDQPTGWLPAYRTESGFQMGRGAVALVLPHDAVETLLSSNHFITRRRDAIRGNRSLDGAVVEALGQAGFTEYVHNPSLVQHTGSVSSMGNPWSNDASDKRFAYAITFPGVRYNALTLLQNATPNATADHSGGHQQA